MEKKQNLLELLLKEIEKKVEKENAEAKNEQNKEIYKNAKEDANRAVLTLKALYDSLIENGFTAEQSFELVSTMLNSMIKTNNNDNIF